MAEFKPIQTTSDKLSTIAKVAGQFIVCTDDGTMYLDTSSTTRIACGGSTSGSIPVNPSDTTDLNLWIETS